MRTGRMKRGFTLIETVVTVGIVAAMAAVVIPQVARQFDAADPARVQNDLKNIQTAIDAFNVNAKMLPGDLEDLASQIDGTTAAADSTLTGGTTAPDFTTTQEPLWHGPYIDATISEGGATETSILTGYGARIVDGFVCYGSASTGTGNNQHGVTAGTGAAPDPTCPATALGQKFLAIQLTGIPCDVTAGSNFMTINEAFDGINEVTPKQAGRVRCQLSTDVAPVTVTNKDVVFFLAVPIT